MRSKSIRFARFTLPALSTLFVSGKFRGGRARPLICHAIRRRKMQNLLPWISHDWNLTGGEKITTQISWPGIHLRFSMPAKFHSFTWRLFVGATLYARKDPNLPQKTTSFETCRARAQNERIFLESRRVLLFLMRAYPRRGLQANGWAKKNQKPCKRARRIHLDEEKRSCSEANDPQMDFAAALITLSRACQPNTRNTRKRRATAQKTNGPAARAQSGSPFSWVHKVQPWRK